MCSHFLFSYSSNSSSPSSISSTSLMTSPSVVSLTSSLGCLKMKGTCKGTAHESTVAKFFMNQEEAGRPHRSRCRVRKSVSNVRVRFDSSRRTLRGNVTLCGTRNSRGCTLSENPESFTCEDRWMPPIGRSSFFNRSNASLLTATFGAAGVGSAAAHASPSFPTLFAFTSSLVHERFSATRRTSGTGNVDCQRWRRCCSKCRRKPRCCDSCCSDTSRA
mmetsp:Transcript_10660/g.28221  ORF Transcript_10660/g.28221 Transcript_10660/m.28221 type:complete len:218 (+) Transcript_10660:1205-1858(+)